MKSVALASLALSAALVGCTIHAPDGIVSVTSPAVYQRALPAPPDRAADAAAAVLRDLGLPVTSVTSEGLVVSGTVTVQERWSGRPVHARVLCGVPLLHMGDREVGNWFPYHYDDDEIERAIAYTAGLPIELRMGFDADPILGGSTVLLLMTATAHMESATPLGPREVACLPTLEFVDELFARIAARLSTTAADEADAR